VASSPQLNDASIKAHDHEQLDLRIARRRAPSDDLGPKRPGISGAVEQCDYAVASSALLADLPVDAGMGPGFCVIDARVEVETAGARQTAASLRAASGWIGFLGGSGPVSLKGTSDRRHAHRAGRSGTPRESIHQSPGLQLLFMVSRTRPAAPCRSRDPVRPDSATDSWACGHPDHRAAAGCEREEAAGGRRDPAGIGRPGRQRRVICSWCEVTAKDFRSWLSHCRSQEFTADGSGLTGP